MPKSREINSFSHFRLLQIELNIMESSAATIEEQKLLTEPKYRVYMSNIDKALKNFEYSSEWADLISALGKLTKVSSF